MSEFKHISTSETFAALAAGDVVIADIRDDQSFASAHIEGAYHLTNGTLHQFMQQTPLDKPVVVVCYHGRSSQGAAQYLAEQGFDTVYSMAGGFESWRLAYPFSSSQE